MIGRFVVGNGVLPSSSRSRRFTALIHQVKVIIYEVSGITSRVSIIMDEVPNPLIPANPYINNRQWNPRVLSSSTRYIRLPTSVQLVLSSYIIHFKSFVSYSSLHKNLNISHCFTSVSFLELLISFCASGVSSASALLPEVIERPGCYRRNFCVPKNDLVPTLPWPWLLWSSYNYMT